MRKRTPESLWKAHPMTTETELLLARLERTRDEMLKEDINGWPNVVAEAIEALRRSHPDTELPDWIADFINRRTEVEKTLREWAADSFVHNTSDFTALANKLSVPTEFSRRRPPPSGAEQGEAVAWAWRWASADDWRLFGTHITEAGRADFIRDQEKIAPIVVQPLYLRPAQYQAGVRVKPLKWHGEPNFCFADTPVGHYTVTQRGEEQFRVESHGRDRMKVEEFSMPEKAQAAAQADYETRIRSALTDPQEGGE